MPAIQESQWNQINIYTWGELSQNLWEDFRLALFESESEMATRGVNIEQSPSTIEMIVEVEAQGVNIVQSPIIMEQKTETIISIVVSDRDYKTEMLKYLPLYERKSGIFNEIITADDRELRNAEQLLEVANRNMFLDTAIESLSTYERDFGIKTVYSLNYNQRREQISSHSRASFGQTTEEAIKNICSAFSNGDVEVIPTTTNGLFEIKFVGSRGIPDNIDGLKEALEIVIPAHLGLTYTFTYNVWVFLHSMTWNEVNAYTWDDLRNEVF